MHTFAKQFVIFLTLATIISPAAYADDWGVSLQYQWPLGERGTQHHGWQLQLRAQSSAYSPSAGWQNSPNPQIILPLNTRWLTTPGPLNANGRMVQQVALLLCGITAIAVTVRAVIGKDDKNN